MPQFQAPLADNSIVIICDHNKYIIQSTGMVVVTSICDWNSQIPYPIQLDLVEETFLASCSKHIDILLKRLILFLIAINTNQYKHLV